MRARNSITKQRRRRGSAILEFALAFVFLMPLFYGTFQFGLVFFYYNELASAVRAGARYGSYRTYDSSTATPSAAYLAAVRNMTICGDPAGCVKPVVPGLQPSHVNVSVRMVSGVPYQVTVSIQNFVVDAVFRTFRLSKPASVFPYLGVYAPAV